MNITRRIKPGMPAEYKDTLSLVLNGGDNGGESITISVDNFQDEDEPPFTNMQISLQCYGSHTTTVTMPNIGLKELAEGALALQQEIDKSN